MGANLKANVTSQVKECGEKTELLTRRSVALEAKSADIERLSLEIQALGRSLDQNNVDLRKKNLWASEAREEAVQTVEELKKTEFELALLRSELAKAVAALSDRYLAAHAHRQSVSEASVETDTLEGEVSRSTEQVDVQQQLIFAATKNTKIVEASIVSKGLEIQRLLGVIATLGTREREEAIERARLHTRVFTLETSIQQSRLANTSKIEDTRVAELETQLHSCVANLTSLKEDYEHLVTQGKSQRDQARALRTADYNDEIRGYEEHLETLRAEILALRGVGTRVRADTSALDYAALAQVLHRERENSALLEAQTQASFEQLSKKEEELRLARSAQRSSDARVGTLAAEAQCKRDLFVTTQVLSSLVSQS